MRLLFILIFSIFLLPFCSRAQLWKDSTSYVIQHFTDEDGLPQNSVKAIVEDNYGFVWLNTEDGLVRFDGSNFVVFDKQNLSCIKSNRFSFIMRNPKDEIFATTDNYDCVKIRNGKAICEPLQDNGLTQLNKQLAQFSKIKSKWATGCPRWQFHPSLNIGTYVIPTGDGSFYECHLDKVRFLGFEEKAAEIAFNHNDYFGFFTIENYLYYHNANGSFSNITKDKISNTELAGDILKDNLFNGKKEGVSILWNIATRSVLIYFNKSFYSVRRLRSGQLYTKLIFSGFDIEFKQIISHHYDSRRKHLFLGSAVKGLYILNTKQFRVLAENSGDQASVYYALTPFGKNSVVNSQGTELGVNDSGKPFIHIGKNISFDHRSVLTDKYRKFIWTKEWNNVIKYDWNFNKILSWEMPSEVNVLYESPDTCLWIGMKAKGLYLTKINDLSAAPKYYSNLTNISYITSEGKNILWVGTRKGLYYLDIAKHKTYQINPLKNKYIRSVISVAAGEVWITTYEDGFYLFRNGKLTSFPHDKGNFLATAHCIVPDNQGYFWITTNKGLFQVARKDLLAYADKEQNTIFYRYYGKEDGLNTNEFNGGCEPCGVKLDNGNIVLPSLDGVVWIAPSALISELPDYKLVVDKVEIDKQTIPYNDSILLPRKFDHLRFFLSTVYFGNRKNIQISYALKSDFKIPDVWYPVGVDNTISFSTLPSGTYRLFIRKVNGFGKKNYTQTVTTIIVPEAFYETIWFIILMILLLVLLVYIYFRVRIFYVMQVNRSLELRIARRTRKLTNTLRALESSESSLRRQTQIQEMLIAAISHDIKSPMKYLLLVSKKMQQFILRKDYESLPVFNEGIQDTAARVYSTLDNLLTYISIQLKKGELKFEGIDLKEMVNDKVSMFEAIAATNFTTIENNISDETFVYSNQALLAVIVHNLIDNAVKFTANGTIKINLEENENESILVIEDTGTGIGADLASWINTSAEGKMDVDLISVHKGMGLIIVRELLSAINATIFVSPNEEKKGTIIRIGIKNQE